MTSVDLKPESLDPRLSPRGKVLLPLGLLLLIGFSVHRLFLADPPPMEVEITGRVMGTTYSVKLDATELEAEERARVSEVIRIRLEEVDALMSTYDPASELSSFNASESVEPQPMSPLTIEVLEVSLQVSERSGGALDVTVGPLVDAWGFGPSGQPPEPPAEAELAVLKERVGYELLTVDPAGGTVRKEHPRAVVDLSAVAKGYAVDRVAQALDSLGYPRYLVEVGGELRAGDPKRDGRPWRVAVETPDPSTRAGFGVVELVRESIATSGDYRNFYTLDGVEYAHLIDPRTGRPVSHRGTSVSVLHERNTVADAWATALSVLGPEEGFRLAEREGLSALFITRDGQSWDARATAAYLGHHDVPAGRP